MSLYDGKYKVHPAEKGSYETFEDGTTGNVVNNGTAGMSGNSGSPAAVKKMEAPTFTEEQVFGSGSQGASAEDGHESQYSPEVMARYNSPDNKPGNFKDLAQIDAEVKAEQQETGTGQPRTLDGSVLPPVTDSSGNNVTDGSGAAVSGKPKREYLADWSRGWNNVMFGTPAKDGQEAIPRADIPIARAMSDYEQWRRENGGDPIDAFDFFPMLSKYDPMKTVAENEKEEKRRRQQEKWQRLGNVFSHVGNLVGTMSGAPSQKIESGIELSERQRKIRDALRDERRNAAKDLLAQWYRDRENERKAAEHKANVDYLGQRKQYLIDTGETNKKVGEARAKKLESDKALVDSKKETEDALRPARVETERGKPVVQKAQVNKNNAQANKARSGGTGGSGKRGSFGNNPDYEKVVHVEGYPENRTTRTRWEPVNHGANGKNGSNGSSSNANKWDKFKRNR